MKVSAGKLSVMGDFGKNVREKVGGSYLGVVVELRADGSKPCRQRDKSACELIRALNSYPHGPMLVGMVGHAKLGCPGIGNPDPYVRSLVVSNGQVDGHWSDPLAVRCQPTPGLSSQDFPLVVFEIHEIEPEPLGMGIDRLVYARSIIAAEIRFQIAQNVVSSKSVRDLEAEARELRGGA